VSNQHFLGKWQTGKLNTGDNNLIPNTSITNGFFEYARKIETVTEYFMDCKPFKIND
jgi:hypothetical protein